MMFDLFWGAGTAKRRISYPDECNSDCQNKKGN